MKYHQHSMDELDVTLAEYNALRSEMMNKFSIQIQMYTIFSSALLIVYGWIIVNKIFDVLLIIPIFTLAIASRFVWEHYVIIRIGDYIRDEIEGKKIPQLIKFLDGPITDSMTPDERSLKYHYKNLWMGWEHSWKQIPTPKYFELSTVTVFFILSYLPAIIYNFYNVFAPGYGLTVYSSLSTPNLALILVVNILIGIYFGLSFYVVSSSMIR